MKYFRFPPAVYDQERTFWINYTGERNEEERLKYPSNFIKTSRYTLINFLPYSLLLQFRRYANIYFLLIAIIQSIKIISPLNPFSAIAPLIFVLGLSMFRQGFEDYARHRSDKKVNATLAYVIRNNMMKEVTWAQILVGDLVMVKGDEVFPADLIALSSSNSGVCYIETSTLDGERNLKLRIALRETSQRFTALGWNLNLDQQGDIFRSNNLLNGPHTPINIKSESPQILLYRYEGFLNFNDNEIMKVMLGPNQLLLRGAYLRNTEWIIGAVVYTGQDTRIMRNAEPARIKSSAIESTMNVLILAILIIQLILCIISASLSSAWQHQSAMKHWYLDYASQDFTPDLNSFLVFFGYFLLYNTMIPISLIVSLEFVKVFQSYFITTDEEMYVKAREQYATVKTTTINEELGQVEYIFSDKTGTLTCNQMEFKYCIIGNVRYGKKNDENLQRGDIASPQARGCSVQAPNRGEPAPNSGESHQQVVFNFQDDKLLSVIQNRNDPSNEVHDLILRSNDDQIYITIETQQDLIKFYFFLLSSAHECIPQTDSQGRIKYGDNHLPNYQGPSPDENTLVDAAAHMGFKFLGSSANEQTFEILGMQKTVELKFLFEFDSYRKRMSVIIRDNGVYKLLVKGADNIIKQRLDYSINQRYLCNIQREVEALSSQGLRCMLMATKILSDREYQQFEQSYSQAATSNNQKQLLDLVDALEKNLYLIGATAVDDKLQEKVPETIAEFLKADIKVWMLTGDKLETAENIAKSCRLIEDMTILRIAEANVDDDIQKKLADCKSTFDDCVKNGEKISFIVDGDSLTLLLQKDDQSKMFLEIAQQCESVVCCRVTPKQKAQVVKLIKGLNKITLAIGDGANDVSMIHEAHIGIGLYGNESMSAVQSSDFALGEFRCLWRLLFIHGHWSYFRISEMILYFFYKNMIFTVPQFFFAFFNAFSAQTLYDDWYIAFYNLIFTALPLIFRATFDKDVNFLNGEQLLKNIPTNTRAINSNQPNTSEAQQEQKEQLRNKYYVGQQKTIFTISNFIFWSIQGAIHGLIVFFGGYASFDYETVHKEGYNMGLGGFGITVLSAIIFIVDIKICLFTKFWTWLNIISLVIFSILPYFIYMLLSQKLIGTLALYTPYTLLKVAHYWLLIFILCGAVFLYDLVEGQIIRDIFPSKKIQTNTIVQQSQIVQTRHIRLATNYDDN